MNTVIRVLDLHKSFSGKKVLDGLNLVIEEGETYVIMGMSGEGKSVLLKHIIGLVLPDSGIIEIFGNNIVPLKEEELCKIRERFGVVFQGSALFDSLTVAENVGFFLFEHTTLAYGKIITRVKEALSLVGLENILNLYPASLSGGMKKRVALARAIITEPKVLFYDEPTTGLDPILKLEIDELIKNIGKRLGVTSVIVTHDLVSAYDLADKIAMLDGGKIVACGSPDEIRNSKNPKVRQFIGKGM
ncbi:MAG: ABC transporter ATP-binding protein [bacterium]|nr:ABC transporter ATP-binding protein [bacterium]